jgi:hypothetical protein
MISRMKFNTYGSQIAYFIILNFVSNVDTTKYTVYG